MFRFSGHYARENAGHGSQILACAAPDGTTDEKLDGRLVEWIRSEMACLAHSFTPERKPGSISWTSVYSMALTLPSNESGDLVIVIPINSPKLLNTPPPLMPFVADASI